MYVPFERQPHGSRAAQSEETPRQISEAVCGRLPSAAHRTRTATAEAEAVFRRSSVQPYVSCRCFFFPYSVQPQGPLLSRPGIDLLVTLHLEIGYR